MHHNTTKMALDFRQRQPTDYIQHIKFEYTTLIKTLVQCGFNVVCELIVYVSGLPQVFHDDEMTCLIRLCTV